MLVKNTDQLRIAQLTCPCCQRNPCKPSENYLTEAPCQQKIGQVIGQVKLTTLTNWEDVPKGQKATADPSKLTRTRGTQSHSTDLFAHERHSVVVTQSHARYHTIALPPMHICHVVVTLITTQPRPFADPFSVPVPVAKMRGRGEKGEGGGWGGDGEEWVGEDKGVSFNGY